MSGFSSRRRVARVHRLVDVTRKVWRLYCALARRLSPQVVQLGAATLLAYVRAWRGEL